MATFDAKKDFSAEVKLAIPESVVIAKNKSLDDAISFLLPLEKKCRVNNDFINLKEVSVHLVRLCRELEDWEKINSVLSLINKRSSQYKVTLTAVVEEALSYIDVTPSLAIRIDLIKSLKEVCDGKIYLESESARLHFSLAKIYEDSGDIGAACDITQDVHVETYGSLSKKEKADYILEQIRLNLLRRDYIRTAIHSRKMNRKTIEEEGFEKVKVQFYTLQIEYYTYEKNTWEICQAYYKIAETKLSDSFSSEHRKAALEACVVYLLASKRDNHQSDMLHRMNLHLGSSFKDTPVAPEISSALSIFSKDEIIKTPFSGQNVLESHACLSCFSHVNIDVAGQFVEIFRNRVIEHNLRVVAKYYHRIHLKRLEELVNLASDKLEEHLSAMSFAGDISLKIDRPAGIVSFQKSRTSEEVLSEWSSDISKMLNLMEATCHLINRENMVHKV